MYSFGDINNNIVLGDCLQILPKIEGSVFDLVFLDPPYFMELSGKSLRRWDGTEAIGVIDQWDRFNSQEEYDDFLTNLLQEVRRLMKPTATLWTIGTYHNIFIMGRHLQDLGFWILNDVIWFKNNPMPNWRRCRFTNATETLIWCVKDRDYKKYIFNSDYAKQFGLGSNGNNVWRLPVCRGRERIKTTANKKLHSTQKPVGLLRRILLTSTQKGDLVLDPMCGTGTSGFVAKLLGRNYFMIDNNPVYVEAAKKRLQFSGFEI